MQEKTITSFLIRCDRELNIINIFWNKPVYMISPYQTRLKDLFADKEEALLDSYAAQALEKEDMFYCHRQLELRFPKVNVSVCFTAVEESVLVYGLDIEALGIGDRSSLIKDIVFDFIGMVKMHDKELMTENERMVRSQFEQIQKLNNDLINTRRQLNKANSRLNILNTELSNRLVKDALTGLVSRYQYREEIVRIINEAPDKQGIFTFIDIDDFKRINDTYGHRSGDKYLVTFAKRLSGLAFEKYICMRISGDEFGLYIHGYDNVAKDDIDFVWRQIKERVIHKPINVGEADENIYCSAGMAVYGRDTREIYDLIDFADYAMYIAKKSGKNSYREFDITSYKGELYKE